MADKPGYKTTEFWLTLTVNLLQALPMLGIVSPESGIAKAAMYIGSALASAMATAGYAYSRAKVKTKNKEEH